MPDMLKPEYVNRFSLATNNVSKDAQITFINSVTKLDDKLNADGEEHFEVASIAMSERVLRDLHRLIGDALNRYDSMNT